jgi:glycosyltransferase involved in cell wall biosynthesis
MKLAIVSHCFPPYYARSGGVATYSYNLAVALANAGVEVSVFCGGPTYNTERRPNLTIFRLPYPLTEVPPNFVWFQLRNLKFLSRELSRFDLIHSQLGENTVSLLGKLRSKGAKWAITFHSSLQRELQAITSEPLTEGNFRDFLTNFAGMPVMDFLCRIEIKYADHYFFTARTNIDDYKEFYDLDASRLSFIPNGIDLDEMRESFNHRKQDEFGVPVILFFGRLYIRKGIDLLVKSMPYVLKEHKSAVLNVIGSGPQESRLRSLVRNLDLQEHVFFKGSVSRRELLTELKNSTLTVFPSYYEVQCTSVLEAMACHKPVVAFKVPSMEEIISHMKTGYLVANRNETELANAISYLLSNGKLREDMANVAFAYVQKEHDWKHLAQKYIKTYESIL